MSSSDHTPLAYHKKLLKTLIRFKYLKRLQRDWLRKHLTECDKTFYSDFFFYFTLFNTVTILILI